MVVLTLPVDKQMEYLELLHKKSPLVLVSYIGHGCSRVYQSRSGFHYLVKNGLVNNLDIAGELDS